MPNYTINQKNIYHFTTYHLITLPLYHLPMNQLILSVAQAQQKIERIAFEIYERNFEEPTLVLAGIAGEGYAIAVQLSVILKRICPLEIQLTKIEIDKTAPYSQPVKFDIENAQLAGKVVIVVDDVLYTGRTLAYSLSPLLGVAVKKVQVAVMINRNHHLFPIAADYEGYALSTTLNEHISVNLKEGIYLS